VIINLIRARVVDSGEQVKAVEHDAEAAEEDPRRCAGLRLVAVEQAELTVLDATDARAWADGRAAASRAR
jgi:hypothetical protein